VAAADAWSHGVVQRGNPQRHDGALNRDSGKASSTIS
jgi:hypothetical protein